MEVDYEEDGYLFERMMSLYHDQHSIKRFKTEQKVILSQNIISLNQYNKYINTKDFSKLNKQLQDKFKERMRKFNAEIDDRIKELIKMKFKFKNETIKV